MTATTLTPDPRYSFRVIAIILAAGLLGGGTAPSTADPILATSPGGRVCVGGSHQPGRMRRMVGQAAMTAQPWAYHPTTDQHPPCRNGGLQEADANSREDG